jgi:hypothetical protein
VQGGTQRLGIIVRVVGVTAALLTLKTMPLQPWGWLPTNFSCRFKSLALILLQVTTQTGMLM